MKPAAQRTIWILGTVLVVAFGVQTLRKGLRPQGFDLTAYVEAAAAALRGETPYLYDDVTFPYLYSPFFACAMIPFALLPASAAIVVWYLLSMGALAFVLKRARTWLPRPGGAGHWLAIAVFAVGMFRIVHSNVTNGQVNLILVGMCVAAFEAGRKGQHRRAGCWLALAVHSKALPIVLLGYFLVRRQWETIGWCAMFGAAFALLPALFWGAETASIYASWAEQLARKVAEGTIDHGTWTIASKGYLEYFTLRGAVASLIPAVSASGLVKYACISGVVAGVAICEARTRHRRTVARDAAVFSIYLASALLISPLSEKHHLALMIPAFALGAVTVSRRPEDRPALAFAIGGTLAILLAKPWPSGPFYFLAICAGIGMAWRSAAAAASVAEMQTRPVTLTGTRARSKATAV